MGARVTPATSIDRTMQKCAVLPLPDTELFFGGERGRLLMLNARNELAWWDIEDDGSNTVHCARLRAGWGEGVEAGVTLEEAMEEVLRTEA